MILSNFLIDLWIKLTYSLLENSRLAFREIADMSGIIEL